MRKYIISLILLASSGYASIETSFSDHAIYTIYNRNKDSSLLENSNLNRMFTQKAFDKFVQDFDASNFEKNIHENNYVSTVFKTSPTEHITHNNKSYTTLSKVNVYLTNAKEQLIIPMEITITSTFTSKGLRITQFSSKLTGQISLRNSEQERLKNCGKQTDSRA